VIYIDSSVVLADLFAESKSPPESLWSQDLGSSRLLVYEVWNRLAARRLTAPQRERAPALLSRINLTEMNEQGLSRALIPFSISVRTLDALHLATMEFIRGRGEMVELASYDNRLLTAAAALGIQAVAL
jgi:predicted nucleic acid-binding protein